MSDECTLSDYNVKPGSTVHMVLQLRGRVSRAIHWGSRISCRGTFAPSP